MDAISTVSAASASPAARHASTTVAMLYTAMAGASMTAPLT